MKYRWYVKICKFWIRIGSNSLLRIKPFLHIQIACRIRAFIDCTTRITLCNLWNGWLYWSYLSNLLKMVRMDEHLKDRVGKALSAFWHGKTFTCIHFFALAFPFSQSYFNPIWRGGGQFCPTSKSYSHNFNLSKVTQKRY